MAMERPSSRPSESLSIDFEDILESSLPRSVAVRTWKEPTVNPILVESFRRAFFCLIKAQLSKIIHILLFLTSILDDSSEG
jgi:hypothetical protein